MVKRAWGELQREVLELALRLREDGVTPKDLHDEFGIPAVSAAVFLSRFKKQGILLKRETPNGCRYCLGRKGERKLAYLQSKAEPNEGR